MVRLPDAADRLVEIGRRFDARGWVLGTSGNFSVVTGRNPLRMAITPSAASKGELRRDQILQIDANGGVVRLRPLRRAKSGVPSAAAALGCKSRSSSEWGWGPASDQGGATGKPSAECLLHLRVADIRKAGAVLHTHSIWGTILSDVHAGSGGLVIEGYEMLKGLEGVHTHEHREWIPILDNDQEMTRLADRVGALLHDRPGVHGFLLRRHGLYTWGEDLPQAVRHVEILEFLFESIGRASSLVPTASHALPRRTQRTQRR